MPQNILAAKISCAIRGGLPSKYAQDDVPDLTRAWIVFHFATHCNANQSTEMLLTDAFASIQCSNMRQWPGLKWPGQKPRLPLVERLTPLQRFPDPLVVLLRLSKSVPKPRFFRNTVSKRNRDFMPLLTVLETEQL